MVGDIRLTECNIKLIPVYTNYIFSYDRFIDVYIYIQDLLIFIHIHTILYHEV